MLHFYPEIKPYKTHNFAVDTDHTLYLEEVGNPKGLPIVFLHGGPGAGISENSRRYFDPKKYRIILFDQRGSGKSTPYASVKNNTTQDLIQDIEKIRHYLNVDKWVVFGGSWGSTLALLYAQAHPESVLALILRGIFFGTARNIHWFMSQDGMGAIFPDSWCRYTQGMDNTSEKTLLLDYHQQLMSSDEKVHLNAAQKWAQYEGSCAFLQMTEDLADPYLSLAIARFECHYFVNQCFITENQILENINYIHHIPSIIIHGRYDSICPVQNAWDLKQVWPESTLEIIATSGHSGSEVGIIDGLVRATNTIYDVISIPKSH